MNLGAMLKNKVVTLVKPISAGGTGATAGAFDTAVHRDDLIAAVTELQAAVNAIIAQLNK